MKRLAEGNFQNAWGGIASLTLALPIIWTDASTRGFSLQDIARWMSAKPAQLAGCATKKGAISPGHDADLVILAPEEEFVVTEAHLHYRHRVSPYLNQRLRGVVKKTFLRGNLVFDQGQFPGDPAGRECRRQSPD
jgi:allantoinase